MIHLTISTPPPSLNKLLNMHYMARSRLKRRIQTEVWAQVRQRRFKGTLYKALLTGTRYGPKTLDEDNLIGSLKPVIDALRWSHVIIDDTPDHLKIGEIKQIKIKPKEVARLELTVQDRRKK